MAQRTPKNAPSKRSAGSRPSVRRGQVARTERPRRASSGAKAGGPSAYNAPSLWTKDAPRRATADGGTARRVLGAVGGFLLTALSLAGRGLAALVRGFASLLARSRVALAVFIVALVVATGAAVDFGMNLGKAYPGVRVGEVDAAGKTAEEIAALVEQAYVPRLEGGSVTVYASEDAAARLADEAAAAQDAALAEQLSAEEARANKLAWTTTAADLSARIPADELAAAALAVGRDDGGLPARLGALFFGRDLEVRSTFDDGAVEDLAADIDLTVGDPRVDYDVAVVDGLASVTEGHDGDMLDREAFKRALDGAFLGSPDGTGSFVAEPVHAPLRIDGAAAQAVCDQVNAAIADGARFVLGDASWDATAAEVGAWVATRVEERDGGWALVAFLDEARTKPAILSHMESARPQGGLRVEFASTEGGVEVRTDGAGEVPLVAETTRALEEALFGQGRAEGPAEVRVATGPMPAALSFDEALDSGVIGVVSSYTTEFTTGAGTENRNHNIALVSELLSDSVAKAGGRWSFNGTAGECNEEKGFLGAGAIIDGEYDDAVGGGICQVATTVFNAVYEAGYPVPARRNHSLYIGSYPAGRDAAVSWPDLDLVWENDGASDVLLRVSCADGSVTATLYGVDPGYQVTSAVGEWAEGEPYATRRKVDETLAPNTSYVETRGTDGRSITVARTVSDESGSILHEDVFSSVYDPVTEVVVEGPKAEEKEPTEDAPSAQG
ncbi:VanW family protein [Arabiibacter massiliensis]|uniref:VanW family protein n=1 Tax=Arabiibacter massiliensis TaxID=1870985 RepID=UPI0009B9406E|nr:VanW family protein [Arabiibacter massiliensis]